MVGRNQLEQMALDMVAKGINPHGYYRDILIDMALRGMEEKEEKGE